MSLKKLMVLFSTIFAIVSLPAASVENREGPVHEAYFTPITDSVVYQAIGQTPPDPILERIPTQTAADTVWIPGYWDWDIELQDFIWISGIWRKPPPNHQWISGSWKKSDQGWVRLPGFWSAKPSEELTAIPIAPPASLEENTGTSPGTDYFWSPGFWSYNSGTKKYTWMSGSWIPFDEEWILVPAHYVWRDKGFFFIEPYWDWNLTTRGTPYIALNIPQTLRSGYVSTPSVKTAPQAIYQYYFPWYPNYLHLFQHQYYFSRSQWSDTNSVPPWWSWNGWWSFTVNDNWALWWWWTHPGYPTPPWMTASLAKQIPPPSKSVLGKLKDIPSPTFVTSKGVVGSTQLLDAFQKQTGTRLRKPILPSDIQDIDGLANAIIQGDKSYNTNIRPTGKVAPLPANLPKPNRFETASVHGPIGKGTVPFKPGMPSVMRSRPSSPGSEIKPQIKRTVFPEKIPSLAPPIPVSQNRARGNDEVAYGGARDRSEVQYGNPQHADRPPYTRPTTIIIQKRDTSSSSTPYDAPSYQPQRANVEIPSSIYETPKLIKSANMRGSRDTQWQRSNVDPFNPEGMPSRIQKRPPGQTVDQQMQQEQLRRMYEAQQEQKVKAKVSDDETPQQPSFQPEQPQPEAQPTPYDEEMQDTKKRIKRPFAISNGPLTRRQRAMLLNE